MQHDHDIDDLFRSSLGGQRVPYSEHAWAGAEALLNRHYRKVMWKRALWILFPLLLISGSGLWWWSSGVGVDEKVSATVPESSSVLESSASGQPEAPASRSDHADVREDPNSSAELTASEEATNGVAAGTAKAGPTVSKAQVAPLSVDAKNGEPVAGWGGQADAQARPEPAYNIQNYFKETHRLPNGLSGDRDDLATMPAFRLQRMWSCEVGTMPDERSMIRPEKHALQRVQVFAGGGLLAAYGFRNLEARRQLLAPGWHTTLDVQYHRTQMLYFNAFAGAFSRGGLGSRQAFYATATEQLVLDPLMANYAAVGLGFGYRFGARHAVGLSIQYDRLVSVLVRQEIGPYNGEPTSRSIITDNFGFAKDDMAFALHYRLGVGERWDATTDFQMGFIDMTENRLTNRFDPNALLKVGLAYRLTAF